MKSIWTKKHVDTQTDQDTVHYILTTNQKFILAVTGIIYEDKINRLLPKRREMLTFLY